MVTAKLRWGSLVSSNARGSSMVTEIALFAGVIAAFTSGGFTLANTKRLNRQAFDIERLKARLGHDQLVSSTQWNAEFAAYQALWKSFVPIRTVARKLVQ